ncbi:hypothetical protein SAMN05444000_1018 [Shimia gijangensis]|uniref:SMODS and SLOG-associating 2TM effector domain-containing protein n=1 Tax=Shimia gijangensis TaxID=1470563 RepID=A0A1M6AP90_9RHOB|nr:hypothetical protein [Shimia gijangensis]SHI38314.1 hypothetical protein SAMN05444000_1018 [Shimia gijangensis]
MSEASILSFVVGVTGHRDIPKQLCQLVEENVAAQLRSISEMFSSLPIEIVSGLAAGADTLVAEQALALGMKVTAVLPMPAEMYEADFDGEDLERFRTLLVDERVSVTELPVLDSENLDRDHQYVLLKDYLVRRSNLLIALWDGEVTGLAGGTSDVVLSYLGIETNSPNLQKLSRSSNSGDDGNLVISISTPRVWSEYADGEVGFEYLVSEGAEGCLASLIDFPKTIFDRWKNFNSYAAERFSTNGESIVSYDLFSENDPDLVAAANLLNEEFIRADQLAIQNQKRSDMLFKGFGLMAGAMGLLFLVYAKLASMKIFLVAYLVLFAAGYVLFKVGHKRAWFSKHLGYRAFAETIRIRYFLELSGCGDAVDTSGRLKLMKVNRFKGLEWIVDAARCTETLPSLKQNSRGVMETTRRWVEDQSKYFEKKVHHLHAEHERLETIKKLLFFGSFIGTLALIFFKKDLYHLKLAGFDGKTLLVFLMGLLPLWLALWELYQSKMAIRELAWQYSNQAQMFTNALRRLNELQGETCQRAIITDLADSSFAEALQWTVHRYHREHEPPTAG